MSSEKHYLERWVKNGSNARHRTVKRSKYWLPAARRRLCLRKNCIQQLLILLLLCAGRHRWLLLIADGACWIRTFYAETPVRIPNMVDNLNIHVPERAKKVRDLLDRHGH